MLVPLRTSLAQAIVYSGADPGDRLGEAVLGILDFNGDAQPDILMGAPGADGRDNASPDSGAAYLVYRLPVDIEDVRQSMNDEELFRQEFGCEFLDEATAFLPYEMIARCEEASLESNLDPTALGRSSGDLFAGVDIGRRRDLTVIWVVQRDADTLVTRAESNDSAYSTDKASSV